MTQQLPDRLFPPRRIVNISSGLARFSYPGKAAYAVMKGGVEVLTRYLARELGGRRIRVNTVAPDAIPTSGDEVNAEAVGTTRESYDKKVRFGYGTVDGCAGPILFLATGLSEFMTGTTLHVDGGHAAL